MDFKVGGRRRGGGGAWNTEKYCRPPCLAEKKNSSCFETLSFLPLCNFFLFATQKSGGSWPPQPLWCRRSCIGVWVRVICIICKIYVDIIKEQIANEKIKKRGPGIDPCGTLDSTLVTEGRVDFNILHLVR